jgi:HD superfamily phosphohydrolase YqeK
MFDSICLGLEVLAKRKLRGTFVIPSDIPLFQCFTVKGMIQCFEKNVNCKAIKPLYKQKSGHPILLNHKIIKEIISYDGDGGLKGALNNASKDQNIIKLDFIDEGILMDADIMDDYKKILKYDQDRQELSLEKCNEIQDYFQMSDNVKRHSQKVSEIAIRLGKQLLNKGIDLDLNLLRNASLLHDIAKGIKNHELIGSEWLRDMGYTKIAEVVAEHNCLCDPYDKVNEKMVVYLADKLVLEDKEVNIEERFQRALKKYGGDEKARMNINNRMKLAITIQEKILHTINNT